MGREVNKDKKYGKKENRKHCNVEENEEESLGINTPGITRQVHRD